MVPNTSWELIIRVYVRGYEIERHVRFNRMRDHGADPGRLRGRRSADAQPRIRALDCAGGVIV